MTTATGWHCRTCGQDFAYAPSEVFCNPCGNGASWVQKLPPPGAAAERAGEAVGLTHREIGDALYALCQRIEKCGASTELTNAVVLCSDLHTAVFAGSSWASEAVRKIIQKEGPSA